MVMQNRSATAHGYRRAFVSILLAGGLTAIAFLGQVLGVSRFIAIALSASAIAAFLLATSSLIALGKRLARTAEMESQLAEFGEQDAPDCRRLQSIPGVESVETGWNTLVALLEQMQTLESLEQRLSQQMRNGAGTAGAVLNGLGEGVAVTDLDGQLTVINDALVSLIQPEEAVPVSGVNFQDLLLSAIDGDRDQIALTLNEIAGSVRPATLDVVRGSNGTSQFLRCSRRPNRNDKNEIVGHVWSLRDVTQQHLADEMRENFVATASHELRTPLANIRAYAETLSISEGIDVEMQKEFCNTIFSEATRLGRFVDELLEVTRLQAGSMPLDSRETDMERFLSEICLKLSAQFDKKKIEFKTEFPAKLPKLRIDKDKLSAGLINLLGNAEKYTPEGGEVRFRVESSPTRIQFHVEDTGIGIAPDECDRVFDKFFRSDDDKVRSVTGTGLGLAFTKEVARLHGGDVAVESELGQGSRFTLTLPVQSEGT